MAGALQTAKYESNDGKIYPIRIKPETLIADFNAEPEGGATEDIFAHARYSARKYGIFARYITLGVQVGSGEGPYTTANAYAHIPILSKASFDAAVIGSTVTYQGVAFTVLEKHGERIR
jgi:hypothetical protein